MRADEAGDSRGKAEEHDSLVEEVGAEVVDGAAAGKGFCFPAAGGRNFRAMAVEVGFEVDDAAEGIVFVEGGDGEEVGVPAAV